MASVIVDTLPVTSAASSSLPEGSISRDSEERSTAGNSSGLERQTIVNLLGKRKRAMMKHCTLAPAVQEVPDPDGPSCTFCHVSLRNLADIFKGMSHSGSALKKRKLHPPKKRRSIDAYRDISAQNTWLLATVFDDKGNYKYCNECIVYYLGVGKQRLARLRQTKIEKNLNPIVQMSKTDETY